MLYLILAQILNPPYILPIKGLLNPRLASPKLVGISFGDSVRFEFGHNCI